MSKKKELIMENDNQYDLTVDQLLAFKEPVPLEIPERPINGRPGIVFISELPAKEVLEIVGKKGDTNDWLFDLMGLAVVNRDGSPMFTPGNLKRLSDASFSVFGRLQAKVLELNPIGNPGGESPLEASQSLESPTN